MILLFDYISKLSVLASTIRVFSATILQKDGETHSFWIICAKIRVHSQIHSTLTSCTIVRHLFVAEIAAIVGVPLYLFARWLLDGDKPQRYVIDTKNVLIDPHLPAIIGLRA